MITVFVVVAIIGALIGSYVDFKARWVPDYVSYFMILFGLIGHGVVSLTIQSIYPITYSLIGGGVFLAVAYAMFYSGAWGGGDSKLLVGFGVLLASYPAAVTNGLTWPFLLTLFLNILLVGTAYSIIYMIGSAVRHWKEFSKQAKSLSKEYSIISKIILSLVFVPFVIYFIDPLWFYASLASWGIAMLGFYLFVLAKGVEEACMWKFVKPNQLEIGDHILDKIRIKGKVYEPKLIGLEEDELKVLKKLKNKIKIKYGIPYAPALLLGLLVSVLIGDLLWILVGFII